MTTATALKEVTPPQSLVTKMAQRFSVEPNKLLATLKATAFKVKGEATNEQMMALLIVADQYNLNPFTKEIYAFPDKYGGIVPVVGVDGWSRIINENSQFDGMEFETALDNAGELIGITCTMHRKDRTHPTKVTEFLKECRRATEPWSSHPSRMLRHKAMIQCARLAFGFVGIFDEDEAQRIIEGEAIRVADVSPAVAGINESIAGKNGKTAAPTGAPTYAELATGINTSATTDDLDGVLSMFHDGIPEQQQVELRDLANARRLELGSK